MIFFRSNDFNNDLESNHSFSRYNNTSRQQTMPYLTSSSQLLPEHLRNRPDSLQHSILTSTNTDVRNQNRIPNMKMHSRTNEDGRNKVGNRDGNQIAWMDYMDLVVPGT